MKTMDQVILKVYKFLFPLAVGLVIADTIHPFGRASAFNASAGILISVWLVMTFYLSIKLVASPTFRSSVLTRMARIRERDEREMMVSGRATRKAFLATLAVLIFGLCLSMFRLAVYRVPESQAVNGKTGTLAINLNWNLMGEKILGPQTGDQVASSYFAYPGMPFSATAIFLFLIVWQVFSYNYFVKRIENGEDEK